jgi:hypothetical protein
MNKGFMKKTAVLILVFWSMMACSKNSQNNSQTQSRLLGKWQFTAIFLQPTGTGSWHTEDSIPPDFVQFNKDGSLDMSRYVSLLFGGPDSYQVTSDSTIMFHYPESSQQTNTYVPNIFYYQLADTTLLVYPPDMELAIEKFIKVQPATPGP